ncbi:MAG TPA: RNA 2',3'-cyclic phosphodiesterase [Streptosporangiaceae bacterium]|nr:RNA 2',3'-cyclic phosphodiesterase [Streptosporangiaceae bacterium]
MRLFVALRPPQGALDALEAAVAPLRADRPELRWTHRDHWHVTLAFLGEVDEGRLDELMTRLERAASRHPGRELRIGRGGAFPAASRARVLIARVDGAPADLAGLAALAASVAAGARRAGAPPPDEGRQYRPHLTLARCRQPTDVSDLILALPGEPAEPAEPWPATEIHLIKSQLGPHPTYTTLATWPLKHGTA